MMKMHYKKIGLAIIVIGVLLSSGVLAEDNVTTGSSANKKVDRVQMVQDRRDANQERQATNVCERVAQFSEDFNQKVSTQENNIKTRQQERLTNWSDKTSEADAKLDKLRSNWEINRDEQFAKLDAAATSDEQKKAVNAFEVATKAAITTRQVAVDIAIKTFREGVKNAIATRQGQVDDIVSTSSSNREMALAKVKADCEAGKDVVTVQADFQNGVKGLRTKIQNDHQNVAKVSSTVQALIQTRRTAVEKAMNDFKATMEQSRVALKKAFPQDEASDSATDTEVSN